MLHSFPYLALLAQLAVAPSVHPVDVPSAIPFDTTMTVRNFAGVALNLEAGGRVRIVGSPSKIVRVLVTDHGKHCEDCIVSVSELRNGIDVRTGRTRLYGTPADLQIQVEVPTQTNILLTSAGGQVEIEGIDGYVSGTTDFGAVHLFRLSGAVRVETKRGDVQGTSSSGRVVERRVQRLATPP